MYAVVRRQFCRVFARFRFIRSLLLILGLTGVSTTAVAEFFPFNVFGKWTDYWAGNVTAYDMDDRALGSSMCQNAFKLPLHGFSENVCYNGDSVPERPPLSFPFNKPVLCQGSSGPVGGAGQVETYVFCPEGASVQADPYACTTSQTVLAPKGCNYADNPKDLGVPKCKTGNPCNPANGGKYESQIDYEDPAGFLSVTRHYNSKYPLNSEFGFGWTTSFLPELLFAGQYANRPTSLFIRRPDGRRELFSRGTNALWTGDADTTFKLTEDATGYLLQRLDGGSERYDIAGRLIGTTDKAGRTTFYTREALTGLLTRIQSPNGHALTFGYDTAKNHITSITNSANENIGYVYDANHNLTRVNYPDSTSKIYHYEHPSLTHALTGISFMDTAGTTTRYATYAYDSSSRKATSTEHAGGMEKFSLNYGSETQTTVTNAIGTKEILTFATTLGVKNLVSKINQADNKTLTQTFDQNNNLICKKDEEGRVATYSYNSTNQKTAETIGLTGTCDAPQSTNATRTIAYQYLSPTLDLPTLIESPSVYAGEKKKTQITYEGNLPRIITQSGFTPSGTALSRTVTLSYNSAGQVTSIDGPRVDTTDVTTLSYNECTTGSGCGQLQNIKNALNQTTTFDSYDGNGRLTQMKDANGLRTNYVYDPRGRVKRITQTQPTGTVRITEYDYTPAGDIASVTFPDGRILTYTYTAARKLKRITDNLNNYVEYDYDLKGNRTKDYTHDATGTLVKQIDIAFDARNRISSINAAGSVTQQIFDAIGNLKSETDPNQNPATTHSYDELNRLFTTVNSLSRNTNYTYDNQDRLIEVKAPNNATTRYEYDDLGNLLKEISPDRGTTTYTHDSAGNVTGKTDAKGIATTYSFDALNRLTAIDAPGTADDITYTYDDTSECALSLGKLCRKQEAARNTEYDYDAFGNIVQKRQSVLGTTYTTSYVYDAGDRLLRITLPNGRAIEATRDTLARIRSVSTAINGNATAIGDNLGYRADGLLNALTFGNGFAEARSYDLQGRLSTQTLPDPNAPPTANAGADQTVNEGTAVTLTGSGTDSDGTIASYAWTQTAGPTVTLSGANTATAAFTAPQVTADTTLTFKLTVTDNKGAKGTAITKVTVKNVNQLPTANAGANQTANEGVSVTLTGSGSDADGTIASYQWTQTAGSAVTLSGANTTTATFIAPQVTADTTLTFQLTVTDNDGATASATTQVTVKNVNQLPTVNAGNDQTVNENTTVTLTGSATDPDGTIASYQWTQTAGPAVSLSGATTATASFTAPQVNADTVLSFRLTATDNEGATANATTNVTVRAIQGRDLIVSELSTTTTQITRGQSFAMADTVINQGSTSITGNFSVRFYLSTDATITTSDIAIGSRTISSLAAGAANSASTTVTVPKNTPLGTYYIGAIVDYNNKVAETNETNNAKTASTVLVK